jgi:hypothetical protein
MKCRKKIFTVDAQVETVAKLDKPFVRMGRPGESPAGLSFRGEEGRRQRIAAARTQYSHLQ